MFTRPPPAYLAPHWTSDEITVTFAGTAQSPRPASTPGTGTRGQFDHALWLRLKGMVLDEPGAELTFAGRLSRENGWSEDFAKGVIEEYLRFLYLAARAGHPVTPSDEVDQAWHLHMLYSRHYWGVLCAEVLGFRLEHGPTRGGAAEAAKYLDWYARTLVAYERHFGESPGIDIWPQPADRFDPSRLLVRCPVAVLNKPAFPPRALLLVGVLATASAAFGNGVFKQGLAAPALLVVAVILLIAYMIAEANANSGSRGSGGGPGGCGGGCGSGGGGCGGGCGGG